MSSANASTTTLVSPIVTPLGRNPTANSPFASSIPPSSTNEPGRLPSETLIAGPFEFFDGSMIVEFLHPDPSRDASMLMRTTYKASHPLTKLGRKFPQSPPLHLHFDQFESISIVSGSVGITRGWGRDYRHYTVSNADGPTHVPAWEPHTVWPDPDAEVDSTSLIWSGPRSSANPLDHVFFYNLLCLFSDSWQAGHKPKVLQAALTQYQTGTALVWFPTTSFLGPLRWTVPYSIEALLSLLAWAAGKKPFMEKYTKSSEIDIIRKQALKDRQKEHKS